MSKNINDIVADRAAQQPIVPTEYTNFNDYLDAQTRLTQRLINQPARTCELCGYPMDYKGHKLTKWENKWSIHEVCKRKAENMLDRDSGIARERKGNRVNTAR